MAQNGLDEENRILDCLTSAGDTSQAGLVFLAYGNLNSYQLQTSMLLSMQFDHQSAVPFQKGVYQYSSSIHFHKVIFKEMKLMLFFILCAYSFKKNSYYTFLSYIEQKFVAVVGIGIYFWSGIQKQLYSVPE